MSIGFLFPHFLRFATGGENIKKIDKEYSCLSNAEQIYLSDCGIRYNFVKILDGITTYKYKKTKKLFTALSNFYEKLGIYE